MTKLFVQPREYLFLIRQNPLLILHDAVELKLIVKNRLLIRDDLLLVGEHSIEFLLVLLDLFLIGNNCLLVTQDFICRHWAFLLFRNSVAYPVSRIRIIRSIHGNQPTLLWDSLGIIDNACSCM
jgi:hypothetical protein